MADDLGVEKAGRTQRALERTHRQPGADDRGHAEVPEPIAERAELIVAHRPKPGVVDLENLRAKLGRDGDEAFEARALGVGARAARALQAQMIGQAIGVEAEGEGLPARVRLKRFHIFIHRSPASTMIDCLVTMRLSSAARNNAIRAMSSPSSVCLDGLTLDDRVDGFRRLVPQPPLPIGHHRAGLDRVHANVIRAERARQRMGQADDPGLGRGISRHLGRAAPGDRREIDDRADAQARASADGRLGRQKNDAADSRSARGPNSRR